jgi:hypothetical protein
MSSASVTKRHAVPAFLGVFESPKGTEYRAVRERDIVTLRRKSDGYIEACVCESYRGNWRNDADNTTKLKKLLPELAAKAVRTSIRWCALGTAPQPVWVDVSIALWMLKYDPSMRPSRLI